jgi:hypothetical protein
MNIRELVDLCIIKIANDKGVNQIEAEFQNGNMWNVYTTQILLRDHSMTLTLLDLENFNHIASARIAEIKAGIRKEKIKKAFE